jgi:hypothetical protein
MLTHDATRRQEQLEHLAQVHALSQAVGSAISAIERNDLPQLEIHLAAQETICNRLSGMKPAWSAIAGGKAISGESPDAQLWQEIRQAHVGLAQLNRVYGGLLKRARRSAGLITAIYRGHGEGYDRGRSSAPQHTWSCEV